MRYERNRDEGFAYSEPVLTIEEYTVKTFAWMVLGLLITFGVGISGMMSGVVIRAIIAMPSLMLILLIATLVLSVTMASRIERMSVETARGMFLIFSVLMGVTMSVTLSYYDLGSVMIVFCACAMYFAVMAVFGHFTGCDLSSMGPILLSGLLFLIIYSLGRVFLPFLRGGDWLFNLLGIVLFLGYTAYDTQRIRAYYSYYAAQPEMLEKAAIFSALQLYLDFLNLFVRLLQLFGKRNKN